MWDLCQSEGMNAISEAGDNTPDYVRNNLAMWDDRAAAHAASPDYKVQQFIDDPSHLSDVVRFDLPLLGSVEHGHIIRWDPENSRILFRAELGPLQSLPVNGKLEWIAVGLPDGTTRVAMRYEVAGRGMADPAALAGAVDGVLGQVEVVRATLATRFPDVPVHGVLCFVGCTWNRPMRPKQIKGVTALWPLKLPEFVSVNGLWAPAVPTIADHVRGQLRRAA